MDRRASACYARRMQHAPGFLRLVDAARTRIRECSASDVKRRLDAGERFHLIDVREPDEWARGHLPGAHHLSKGVIERDIESTIPDKAAPIVLQCGGGYRSVLVAENLARMGYTNTWSLAGGWRGWLERGLPVER